VIGLKVVKGRDGRVAKRAIHGAVAAP
jgi:hypothetical protein